MENIIKLSKDIYFVSNFNLSTFKGLITALPENAIILFNDALRHDGYNPRALDALPTELLDYFEDWVEGPININSDNTLICGHFKVSTIKEQIGDITKEDEEMWMNTLVANYLQGNFYFAPSLKEGTTEKGSFIIENSSSCGSSFIITIGNPAHPTPVQALKSVLRHLTDTSNKSLFHTTLTVNEGPYGIKGTFGVRGDWFSITEEELKELFDFVDYKFRIHNNNNKISIEIWHIACFIERD